MEQEERLELALQTLKKYVKRLAEAAGRTEEDAEELWDKIRNSGGVLKELAFYHDNGAFWDGYSVAGYHLTDILVWQVDHFKAYLDRRGEVKRWHPEELFLSGAGNYAADGAGSPALCGENAGGDRYGF